MIHKILGIQNCGRFVNYVPSEKNYGWNGIFSKINTIYAENGSGKTTFTQILKSVTNNDCELIEKRKTLQSKTPITIELLTDDNKSIKYCSSRWTNSIPRIEVFDVFYAEDNMYVFSLGDYGNPSDFYDLVPNSESLLKELRLWIQKRKRITNNIRITYRSIKSESDKKKISSLTYKLNKQIDKKKEICEVVKKKESELNTMVNAISIEYISHVNQYLKKFNPGLEITNTNQHGRKFIYYINVNGKEARSDSSNTPLRHVLSEGDKSSVSLSFFLARIDMLKDIEKRIIVFDDPISSFDTGRRMTTISILTKYAERAQQFFLLSHDLHFIKDFDDRNKLCNNLKIVWREGSSVFVKHNVKEETMTGVSKDIYTLQKYLKEGALNDFEKREVIRCLRPVLEGVFRLKYFSIVSDTEWLGNFLDRIRQSDSMSPLYHLNNIYEDLSDINDYCKQYHHSNPKYMEMPVFDEELRQFVQRTLNVMMFI